MTPEQRLDAQFHLAQLDMHIEAFRRLLRALGAAGEWDTLSQLAGGLSAVIRGRDVMYRVIYGGTNGEGRGEMGTHPEGSERPDRGVPGKGL